MHIDIYIYIYIYTYTYMNIYTYMVWGTARLLGVRGERGKGENGGRGRARA